MWIWKCYPSPNQNSRRNARNWHRFVPKDEHFHRYYIVNNVYRFVQQEDVNGGAHSDIDWFKAYESLNSNLHILTCSTDAREEKQDILDSLKLTLINVNDCIKSITSVSPLLNQLVQFLIDLLDSKHIDVQVRSDRASSSTKRTV